MSGHPEAKGELPLAALAEEIDTATAEGEPIRALIAIAANPVLSAPDGDRLDQALGSLDFMVSVDPYLNETSRHAHVVLPPPPPSQSPHHDFAFNALAVRNQVRYTRAAVPLEPGRMAETRDPRPADPRRRPACTAPTPAAVDDAGHRPDPRQGRRGTRTPRCTAATRANSPPQLTGETGPERRLDMMLRLGPYGDGFGVRPEGLTLEQLLDHPHGIDLGPLQPAPPAAPQDPQRTRRAAARSRSPPTCRGCADALRRRPDGLVLVGRRHLRSNNSWMHNVPALTGGTNRCTLQVHPDDADRLGLTDGGAGAGEGRRGRGGRPRRGHRRRTTRRREPAARLGTRPSRHPDDATPPPTPASTSTSSSTAACSTRCRAPRCSTAYPSMIAPTGHNRP